MISFKTSPTIIAMYEIGKIYDFMKNDGIHESDSAMQIVKKTLNDLNELTLIELRER